MYGYITESARIYFNAWLNSVFYNHYCVFCASKGFSAVSKSPPYARDMWAFGQLVVAIVTKMGSNSDDGILDHAKSCLLNDDPEVCFNWCFYILIWISIFDVASYYCWSSIEETMVTVRTKSLASHDITWYTGNNNVYTVMNWLTLWNSWSN